jgi:uncharacterized phage-like protein YoqJ
MNGCECLISGHSPNQLSFGFDEANSKCEKLKHTMLNETCKLIDNGVTEFLSGMSLGIDMWGAEIVIFLRNNGSKVRLKCILPCETQADKWSVSERERYFTILGKADDEYYISRHYTENCMHDRNKYLVDYADIVLAIYNGKPHGNTAQTVSYAHEQSKSILIIEPETLRVTPYMVVIRGKQQQMQQEN